MEFNWKFNHHHRADDCACKPKMDAHEEEVVVHKDRITEKCSLIQQLVLGLTSKTKKR